MDNSRLRLHPALDPCSDRHSSSHRLEECLEDWVHYHKPPEEDSSDNSRCSKLSLLLADYLELQIPLAYRPPRHQMEDCL